MTGNTYQNQPFGSPNPPPAPKSTNWLLWILGGGFAVCLLVCCGGGVALVGFGMNIVEEDLKNQLRDHPQVKEHVGEITKFDMNFVKTGATDNDDKIVYDVEGAKGTAELTIISDSDFSSDSETIISAVMRLPTGEEIELVTDEIAEAEWDVEEVAP